MTTPPNLYRVQGSRYLEAPEMLPRFLQGPFCRWAMIALVALAGLLSIVIAYRHYQVSAFNFVITPPSALLKKGTKALVPEAQDVEFPTADGVRLSGWYIPSRNGAGVVVVHGSNADRTTMLPEIRFLAAAGFGVLAYDNPGCGFSGGTATWDEQAEAGVHAAVGWLASRMPAQAPIGALGLSLGGYVLTQAAVRDTRISSLVIEGSPPDIVDNTWWEHRKWSVLSQWPAVWALRRSPRLLARPSAEDVIGEISPRPILLIGGDRDITVPLLMARRLYDHAKAPKELWIAQGAEHAQYFEIYPVEYPRRVITFFSYTLLAASPTPMVD